MQRDWAEKSREVPMNQEGIQILEKEHAGFEKRLGELDNFRYLTPEEEYERKVIQKMKLRNRDMISRIKSYET